MWTSINQALNIIDNFVWGVPLMVLIIAGGLLLTIRLGLLQIRKLPLALKWMLQNEEGGKGEISSFSALCTALSATIGTGNLVGVATAVCAGGPGALFWMVVAAFLGMATKYSEGLLAVKYRTVAEDGHSLGGPFYYIELGMGKKFKWLAKIFAFFGVCVGLFGIGTFSQVNGISSAVHGFFDPNDAFTVKILPFLGEYSWSVVIASLILSFCVAAVLIGGVKRIASVSQIIIFGIDLCKLFFIPAYGNFQSVICHHDLIFRLCIRHNLLKLFMGRRMALIYMGKIYFGILPDRVVFFECIQQLQKGIRAQMGIPFLLQLQVSECTFRDPKVKLLIFHEIKGFFLIQSGIHSIQHFCSVFCLQHVICAALFCHIPAVISTDRCNLILPYGIGLKIFQLVKGINSLFFHSTERSSKCNLTVT